MSNSSARQSESALGERTDISSESTGPVERSLGRIESDQSPTLSVVMPTLDEETGIGECIERIERAVAEIGIQTEIIVSDSSTDRTPEIAREMGARVVVPDRPGYGYAYRYAFEHARGEYIAIGDADTTYDFEELPRLFEIVAGNSADMVMGNRLEGTIESGAMPLLHRYVGNPLLTAFLNAFYDAGVSDAHSGFRVIKRDVLDRLELGSDGMEFASEMVMQASEKDFTIEEVPITYQRRRGEATLSSFRDGWRHVRFMLVNAPSYLFTVPGTALAILGALIMVLTVAGVTVGGRSLGVYSMVAGSLLTIVGNQVVSLGVFSSAASDPIQKPRDVITQTIIHRFTLGSGTIGGLVLSTAGGAYFAFVLGEWITTGYSALPSIAQGMLAFTAIVLGVQMVFSSFFYYMIEN